MIHRRTVILVALLSAALCAVAGREARADYVGNKFVEPGTGNVLEYNVYVPTGYDPAKKYPIMLVLHAANTNQIPPPRTLASDGKGWAATFIGSPHQATDPSFFMIPISQTNASGWGEATQPITTQEKFEGRLAVLVLRQEVMSKYSIDPTRLYLTGPSMGGRGTWDIIRRYPGLFAAAAPAAAPALPADASLYLNQNIWAICGEVDPIVQGERDTIVAIRKLGGNPIYTELAGHGHDSWRSVYPDQRFVQWIFAQRLGVPWWTVSTAPSAPFSGATLTPGWPAVDPPAGLGTSFGGMSGSSGGASGAGGQTGSAGAGGLGGTTGTGGTSSSGGAPGPGTGGVSTGGGSGASSGLGGSSGSAGAGGASPGSQAGTAGSAGGAPTQGGQSGSSGGGAAGTQVRAAGTTNGSGSTGQAAGDGSAGCTVASAESNDGASVLAIVLCGALVLGRGRRSRAQARRPLGRYERVALFTAVLSVALSACAGSLDPELFGSTGSGGQSGSSGGGMGGSAAVCDAPTIVFAPKCAQAVCHAATAPASGLDLASAGVAARLLGKSPDGAASLGCSTLATPFLVPQSNPATGLLIEKLNPPVPCGLAMPLLTTLSSSEATCIDAWATAVTTGVITQ